MNISRLILLAFSLSPLAVRAQSPDSKTSDCGKLTTASLAHDCSIAHAQVQTIYLKNATGQNDANEIQVATRNIADPSVRIYLDASRNAIVVATYPEEFARIEALVRSLDRPQKIYRLTYTLTEFEAGKSLGTSHLSMVVTDNQRTVVKQGDKVPVATGSFSTEHASAQTQFTYLDVGMNFDATLNGVDGGAMLKTKVEQSSIGQTNTIAGVQEPVVRQTVLEGVSFLPTGKAVMLGTIDVPNSTRHLDIAVAMEQIR